MPPAPCPAVTCQRSQLGLSESSLCDQGHAGPATAREAAAPPSPRRGVKTLEGSWEGTQPRTGSKRCGSPVTHSQSLLHGDAPSSHRESQGVTERPLGPAARDGKSLAWGRGAVCSGCPGTADDLGLPITPPPAPRPAGPAPQLVSAPRALLALQHPPAHAAGGGGPSQDVQPVAGRPAGRPCQVSPGQSHRP